VMKRAHCLFLPYFLRLSVRGREEGVKNFGIYVRMGNEYMLLNRGIFFIFRNAFNLSKYLQERFFLTHSLGAMAAALPIAKITGLLIKTLSKPMAKRLKKEALKHPSLSTILLHMGQFTHASTQRLTLLSQGFKVKSVNPLLEENAIAKGAEILGETIVFSVACGVVIWEYSSSQAKAEKKRISAEQLSIQTDARHEARLAVIDERLDKLEKIVRRNENLVARLGGGVVEGVVGGVVGAVHSRPQNNNLREEEELGRRRREREIEEGIITMKSQTNPGFVSYKKLSGDD